MIESKHFVWSKMGDEANEELTGILARKEAERLAGSFWCGIGNNIDATKLQRALKECGGTLPVLFSKQLTCPDKSRSGGMSVWTKYECDGHIDPIPIPNHALVISKKDAKSYYALVCQCDESIAYRDLPPMPIDPKLFVNFDNTTKVGSSQVTSLVTGLPGDHSKRQKGRYEYGFRATLVKPWLVRLRENRPLAPDEEDRVRRWKGNDYQELVRRIRNSGLPQSTADNR